MISCPWEKMAACFNLARTMSSDPDLIEKSKLSSKQEYNFSTQKIINNTEKIPFLHVDKSFFNIFSEHSKNTLNVYDHNLCGYLNFFEGSFTLPQFFETFNSFIKEHPELVSKELYQDIFKNVICHSNISDEKAKELAESILNPSYNRSVFLFAGWDEQVQLIFSKFNEELFLYAIPPGGRFTMFKVHKKDKITPEWIKSIVTRAPFKNTRSMDIAQVLERFRSYSRLSELKLIALNYLIILILLLTLYYLLKF